MSKEDQKLRKGFQNSRKEWKSLEKNSKLQKGLRNFKKGKGLEDTEEEVEKLCMEMENSKKNRKNVKRIGRL